MKLDFIQVLLKQPVDISIQKDMMRFGLTSIFPNVLQSISSYRYCFGENLGDRRRKG